MNITYLNNEIALATKIFLYYSEKTLDYLTVNNDKYKGWYKDSLQLSYLLSLLKSATVVDDDTNVIGYKEFSNNILVKAFYKVREYWLDEIDSEYLSINVEDIVIPPTKPIYYPFTPEWKSFVIEITTDNTLVIELASYNFDLAKIDPNSLMITVNQGLNPIEIISDNTKEGCRIVNNIFYWNAGNYYDLNDGDQLYFKYLQISS